MPKFRVLLSRLNRETKVVTVEAESREDVDLKDVYFEQGCDEDDWEPDVDWGTEPGTHIILED